jgi:hypothetical protein
MLRYPPEAWNRPAGARLIPNSLSERLQPQILRVNPSSAWMRLGLSEAIGIDSALFLDQGFRQAQAIQSTAFVPEQGKARASSIPY